MCLFSSSRPKWEEEVTFSNRRHPRHRMTETTVVRSSSHSHHHRSRTPSIRAPSIRHPTPPSPKIIHAPSPPPPPPAPSPRIELISVEESLPGGPPSVHTNGGKRSKKGTSRRGSVGSLSNRGEEVYIEREREIQRRRVSPQPQPQVQPQPEYETYRYVPGARPVRGEREYRDEGRTGKVVEREHERVVVNNDDGSRERRGSRRYYN